MTPSGGKQVYTGYYEDGYSTLGSAPRYLWALRRFFGGVPRGLRVLEVGMGDGGVLPLLKDGNRVVGADASAEGVAAARARGLEAHHLDASLEPLPGGDGDYDLVIALETAEHLENPYHFLREVQRVLRRDGTFLLSIPNPRTGHPLVYPALFRLPAFREFLRNAGFRVKRIYPQQVLSKAHRRWRWLDEWLLRAVAKLSGGRLTWFYGRAWSWYFECVNVDPQGAVRQFGRVCHDTRGGYHPMEEGKNRQDAKGAKEKGTGVEGERTGAEIVSARDEDAVPSSIRRKSSWRPWCLGGSSFLLPFRRKSA